MISRDRLHRRAALIQALRRFFIERRFLEVDTPVRLPALAPEAHIEPEPASGWFLQTSPELAMKRLLAAGIPRLFQLCKCFRRGERGSRHLAEFTMLEWYRAGGGYRDLMDDCEELLLFLGRELGCAGSLTFGGRVISLSPPWERLEVAEAFRRHAPVSMAEALGLDLFDQMLVEHIEPRLGLDRPVFLHDYPASLASLAAISPRNSRVAERFELYINGLELANGFTELIDPAEQRRRFEAERRTIAALGRDPGPMPERFLADLSDMPPSAGIALGVDRLAMVFVDAETIDQVVTFRPEDL